jgi:MFS family permease
MPLADQAKWFSWSAALFGFIGVLSAGFISDHWSKKNIRGRIYMCITTSLAVIPFFTIAMLANHSSLISICVGVMPLFFVAQMWTGSAGAVVTNICKYILLLDN